MAVKKACFALNITTTATTKVKTNRPIQILSFPYFLSKCLKGYRGKGSASLNVKPDLLNIPASIGHNVRFKVKRK